LGPRGLLNSEFALTSCGGASGRNGAKPQENGVTDETLRSAADD
jgi:hypothetical protein